MPSTKGRAKVNDNTGEDERASIGRCEAAVDKVGKQIAKEMPNYAAEAKDDMDASDEMDAIRNDLQKARAGKDMKDIGLCKRLEKYVAESNVKSSSRQKKAKLKTKVTTEEVREYNRQLVAGREGDDRRLKQVYRLKRLQQMMGDALFITSSGRSSKLVSGPTWETSRTQPYRAITIGSTSKHTPTMTKKTN